MEDRLKTIEECINRAKYPIDTINSGMAKDQLASVDAEWMLSTIRELLTQQKGLPA